MGVTLVGKLAIDLNPLIQWVEAAPLDEWVFRGDPESHKTCVITPNQPRWREIGDEVTAVLDAAIGQYLKPGYVNRVVLSCVPAGEQILPHTDDFGELVRQTSVHCHIPLITDSSVVVGFDDGDVHLEVGHLYIFDETKRHWVINPSGTNRIHLLFAFFPHDTIIDFK